MLRCSDVKCGIIADNEENLQESVVRGIVYEH